MTNYTPEQYRALADELQSAAAIDFGVSGDTMFAAQTALRAAADQLEAVRQVVVDNSFQADDGEEVVYSDLVMAMVYPANTPPQEDHDD